MKNKTAITAVLGLGLIILFMTSNPQTATDNTTHKATIKNVIASDDTSQTLEIAFVSGPQKGTTQKIVNDESFSAYKRVFDKGDTVLITQNPETNDSYISDYVRTPQLLVLFIVFAVITLLITGLQGFGALVGMGASFVVIFKLILPAILAGYSPLLTVIGASALIIPLIFYPSHGINKKTNIAVVSTLLTLIITGGIATFFANYTHLTGLASEEANFLSLDVASKIDFQGLILAGILISILGVLDDITVSQASVVQQLKLTKKNIKFSELFERAMIVGRDHIASLVNTLILVYAGAALPLLLLFLEKQSTLASTINLEFMAEEIVRTLIGSIAIILAVPITTFLAAMTSVKGVKVEEHHHCH